MDLKLLASNIDAECRKRGTNKMLLECGLSKATVDNIKNGSVPGADKLLTIAKYLGVPLIICLAIPPKLNTMKKPKNLYILQTSILMMISTKSSITILAIRQRSDPLKKFVVCIARRVCFALCKVKYTQRQRHSRGISRLDVKLTALAVHQHHRFVRGNWISLCSCFTLYPQKTAVRLAFLRRKLLLWSRGRHLIV